MGVAMIGAFVTVLAFSTPSHVEDQHAALRQQFQLLAESIERHRHQLTSNGKYLSLRREFIELHKDYRSTVWLSKNISKDKLDLWHRVIHHRLWPRVYHELERAGGGK